MEQISKAKLGNGAGRKGFGVQGEIKKQLAFALKICRRSLPFNFCGELMFILPFSNKFAGD